MLLGGSLLLFYQFAWNRKNLQFKLVDLFWYAQIILFGVYGNYILRFWALGYLSSAKANFLYNFSPFFSAFYSYLIFDERINKRQWLGLTIGLVGMIPILMNSSPDEVIIENRFFLSLPELATILSVMFHTYSWIIVRKLVRDQEYHPVTVNGITMTSGGMLALITSLFVEEQVPIPDISAFIGWLLLVILISNIICYSLYGYLLKQYTATFLSFANFLSPIFGAFYGWAFLNETITFHFFISGLIVFTGLYIFYLDEFRKNRTHLALNAS
jgi:drug/metabolite transporter (DMT)-like permease